VCGHRMAWVGTSESEAVTNPNVRRQGMQKNRLVWQGAGHLRDGALVVAALPNTFFCIVLW